MIHAIGSYQSDASVYCVFACVNVIVLIMNIHDLKASNRIQCSAMHSISALNFNLLLRADYVQDLAPNVDCTLVNLIMTVQTILKSLLDYSMLGLVYARRATTYPISRAHVYERKYSFLYEMLKELQTSLLCVLLHHMNESRQRRQAS
jgi:hypothetical protein